MRIDIKRILAVLPLAAILLSGSSALGERLYNRNKQSRKAQKHKEFSSRSGGEEIFLFQPIHFNVSEIKVLRDHGGECCPSKAEMVEMTQGKNQQGMLVNLYSGGNPQRFNEIACEEGVAGQPCRGLDKRLHSQSTCVQKYAYSYALVVDTRMGPEGFEGGMHSRSGLEKEGYKMDYIQLRAGCSCTIKPKSSKNKKSRSRRNPLYLDET